MRFFLYFIFSIQLLPIGIAEESSEDDARETKLYETIGELIDRRDETLKKFAVILQGEGTGIRPGQPPNIVLRFHCRVVDVSRKFDLAASFVVYQNENLEHGDEIVRIKDQWKGRQTGSLMALPYEEKPKDKRASAWLKKFSQAAGLDPFDDFMLGANGLEFRNESGGIEKMFLKRGKLLSSKSGLSGRLIADWEFAYPGNRKMIKTIEFDPAHKMMPIRVSDRVQDSPNDFWEMRMVWSKFKTHLLPSKIETAEGDIDNGNSRTEYTYLCHWAIGDEVPDSIFESADHLAALFDHFQLSHSVRLANCDIIHPHYEAPAGLYDDDNAVRKAKPKVK